MTNVNIDTLKAQGLSEKQIEMVIRFAQGNGKTGKTPRLCRCGCGGMTKGGVYRPGHDAKHVSATLAALRGEPIVAGKHSVRIEKEVENPNAGTRVDVGTGEKVA